MKKKVLCTAMVVTILLTQTASAAPWQMRRNQLIFDSEIEFLGNVTLQFASDCGSFIRPITKRYGESISLESYVPTKYGYTFKGWFTDPRTKQNQVTTFKFTKPDVLYAKWKKNPEEPINPNDEIMAKALLEKRQKKFTHTTYGDAGIFTKMIYCKNCGTPYKHKGDGVWTCRTHDVNIDKCNVQPVTEELIKKAYILMYNRLKANYKHILIPFINQIEAMKTNQSEKDAIAELNIQIAQVSERVMMINRLKDNNLADPSFYMQELNECDRRMMELKARKNKILHENRYSKIVTDTRGLVKELKI